MKVPFTNVELLAIRLLAHLQYDKTDPNWVYYDNFYNGFICWFCVKILKVNIMDLFKRVNKELSVIKNN